MATEATKTTGEALEKSRRRRKTAILALCFAVGLVIGLILGTGDGGDLLGEDFQLSATAAATIAAGYLLVVFVGGFVLARQTDEVELLLGYKAYAGGVYVYMLAYPVWLLLWLGGLLPEPRHSWLFVAFCTGITASYLFHRFR